MDMKMIVPMTVLSHPFDETYGRTLDLVVLRNVVRVC
jgi:hypothetical protein